MDSTNAANVTDDQELAKVLESMNQQATAGAPVLPETDNTTAEPTANNDGLAFEETSSASQTDSDELPAGASYTLAPEPTEPVSTPPVDTPVVDPLAASTSPELDSIKKTALEELRPLVDKLDLPADEKFDTLLLLIRSTDDKSLVGAAHEAARAIEDETKRAQALLDVIKEIDYFSGHGQQPQ